MNTLVLEWADNGGGGFQHRTQTFTDTNPTRNPGTFRIGRDPSQCDLLINNNTVSRLHVEIWCDKQRQTFFLRNLAPNNAPIVDGQLIAQGQVALRQGGIITLGQVTLNITSISVEEEIAPTLVVVPPPQPRRSPSPQLRSTNPPLQQPVLAPQPVGYYQPQPQVIAHQHQHGLVPGLECPRCHKVSDYSHLEIGCPWCGTSLGAAVSVLVNPNRI